MKYHCKPIRTAKRKTLTAPMPECRQGLISLCWEGGGVCGAACGERVWQFVTKPTHDFPNNCNQQPDSGSLSINMNAYIPMET